MAWTVIVRRRSRRQIRVSSHSILTPSVTWAIGRVDCRQAGLHLQNVERSQAGPVIFDMTQNDRQQFVLFAIKPDGAAVVSPLGRIGDILAGDSGVAGPLLVVDRHHLRHLLPPVDLHGASQRLISQDFENLFTEIPQHFGIGNRRTADPVLELPGLARADIELAHRHHGIGEGLRSPRRELLDQFIDFAEIVQVDDQLSVSGVGRFRLHRQVEPRRSGTDERRDIIDPFVGEQFFLKSFEIVGNHFDTRALGAHSSRS